MKTQKFHFLPTKITITMYHNSGYYTDRSDISWTSTGVLVIDKDRKIGVTRRGYTDRPWLDTKHTLDDIQRKHINQSFDYFESMNLVSAIELAKKDVDKLFEGQLRKINDERKQSSIQSLGYSQSECSQEVPSGEESSQTCMGNS